MNPFFVYLIKSTISLALFYIVFKLAVSRDKMHSVNRFVLLGILVTSAILPFADIPVLQENDLIQQVDVFRQFVEAPVLNNSLPAVSEEIQSVQQTKAASVNYVLLFYFFVIFLLIVRLIVSVVRVLQIIQKAEKQPFQSYILAVVKDFIHPFSFLRNIVISEKDYTDNKEMVITHEYAHIKHFHAIDLIICELFTTIHWFNPFVWLLRRDLRLIHEYQADQAVLNKGIDATKYQLLVIEKAVGERRFAMANHFKQKPILKRIKMMQKKNMKWMNGMKLILFIPAFTLLLMAFGKTNVKLSPIESVVGQVDEKINYDQSQNDKLNLVIEIKKDGNYIDGTLMSIEEILNKAKSLQKEGREIVLLKIDGTLPHSRVDEVREALESVNIIHINQSYFGTEEIVYPIGDVSIHPKFKQGNWNDWVNNQLKDLLMGKPNYGPATLVYGFIIDYNGKVRDAHIITASDIPEINAAYEKVLAQAPDWQPARKGNKNVSVFHKIRIGSKVVQVLRIDLKHDDKELDLERIKKEAEVKFKSTNGECSSVIYAEEGVSEDDIKAVKEVLKKAGIKIITVTNNIPPSPVNLKLSRENEVFIGEYIYPKTGNVTKVIAWSKKVNLEELQEYLIKQKDLVEKENKKNGTKYDLVVNVNVEVGVTDKQNSTLKEVLRKTKIQHLNYSSEIQEEDWKSKK